MMKQLKNLEPWGSVLIRLVVGLIFVLAGFSKVTSPDGFAGMLAGIGFPAAGALALVVGIIELVGGVLLIANIWTEIVAILLGIIMVVALFTVHLSQGWNGMRYVILMITVLIYFIGKGGYCPITSPKKKQKYSFM